MLVRLRVRNASVTLNMTQSAGRDMTSIRIALFGAPGAGKSTATAILSDLASNAGFDFRRIRLADPLYQCQNAIYEIAGCPLADFYTQDGVLLNFLGSHLRRINPTVLLDSFDRELVRLGDIGSEYAGRIIACDDMRASEATFLAARGFRLVRVAAPTEICLSRRAARGDVSLGSSDHPTEAGLDVIAANEEIPNSGSLDDLQSEVTALLRRLLK